MIVIRILGIEVVTEFKESSFPQRLCKGNLSIEAYIIGQRILKLINCIRFTSSEIFSECFQLTIRILVACGYCTTDGNISTPIAKTLNVIRVCIQRKIVTAI